MFYRLLLGGADEDEAAFSIPTDYLLVGHVQGTVVQLGGIRREHANVVLALRLRHLEGGLSKAYFGVGVAVVHA